MPHLFHPQAGALAPPHPARYSAVVAVNPVTGRRGPNIRMAHKRPHSIAGAFFASAMSFYGGRAWDTFGCAGVHSGRSANPRTAATLIRFAANRGSSYRPNGALPMKHSHALNPSARIDAHKAMALAALRANSSLSTRLARYNTHMAKARALEVAGSAQ